LYSVSKTPITKEIIEQIAHCHFGQKGNLLAFEELHEGYFNTAVLLSLSNGFTIVLKVAPPPHVKVLQYEKDILRTEVEVMRLVWERTSIPVPQILAYDNSHHVIESDYYLMAYIPGISYHKIKKDLEEPQQAKIDRQVGEWVRSLNDIQGEAFGYYALQKYPTWREAFMVMYNGVIQDGREMNVELPYPSLLELLQQNAGCLEEVRIPQLVHWDLWEGNIFIDPETKEITGIVDFERALWGDPLMEVNFACMAESGPFMEGYGRNLLATESCKRRRLLYNIYLAMIMVIECYFRQYQTKDQENMARQWLENDCQRLSNFS
jgi:aminoglycoside phosphotransferase (APT) family kinase protein